MDYETDNPKDFIRSPIDMEIVKENTMHFHGYTI